MIWSPISRSFGYLLLVLEVFCFVHLKMNKFEVDHLFEKPYMTGYHLIFDDYSKMMILMFFIEFDVKMYE